MTARLFIYLQAAIKLGSYPIALLGWAVALASNVRAASPVAEPTSDLFDSDNISPSQIFNKSDRETPNANVAQKVTNPRAPQLLAQVFPVPNLTPIFTLSTPISIPAIPRLDSTNPLNSIITPELIVAPNNTPAVSSQNAPTQPDSRFILPPRELDPATVDPFSTQFILNGDKISHFTPTIVKTGYESGNFRTSDLNFNVYKVIKSENIQSVTKDVVLRVDSQIESVGVRSIERQRDLTVAVSQPQTLLGVRQQISLDGDCLDGSGRTCTFLPGLRIDESNLNRQLQPTGVTVTSQFGDVISPASVAAIREPGFQGGANGENYGIDLTVPAIGLVTTPWSANPVSTGSRREDITAGVAVNYTRMNQNLATNGVESVLGRTIRSVTLTNNERNQAINLGVVALGQVLPAARPSIAAGTPGTRIVVNPNLYRAANAIRIPENSQTVFQTGTGYAISRGADPKIPPAASHQAIWVGLSPVVERQVVRDYNYVTRRDPQIVQSGGGEGGSVPVAVNLNNFGFNSGSLQNVYSQGYVTVYNRDVDRVDVETLRQRTDYFPHVSFTGTSLTENSLWRYYTGAIASIGSGSQAPQNIKAYVGTDYAVVNPRGLSYSFGGIGYLNPDPEYATQLFVNTTQAIPLGANPRNNLSIGVNANYIVDGSITIQSLPVRSTQSFVNAGVNVNIGDISIGGTQFIGNILPESTDSKTLFNIGWKVTDRLNIGAFYTVADRNISTNPYGANLSYALDPNSDSMLFLGWNAAEIDFRRTLGPTSNIYRDNTFTMSIRYGF
ncbi:hypothetical protein [Chamaesiphon sp. VAR_48_metabat_403]|uniref:hypothetical protein n=1 Tax=Chamaesiphon sp. VAR_48_metabat_403 TaxID=2964700 RepID=UPI00286E1313|nr:hypothetical protein [Chamaesiphon sp. VAR_48_metabat_403]